MKNAQSVGALLGLLAACAFGGAHAQDTRGAQSGATRKADAPPQAHEERAAGPDEARRPPATPAARPAAKGKKPPPRRRSVQQIIGSMPQPSAPRESYGPVLYQRGPAPVASSPGAGFAPPAPTPPAQINSCNGGFCTDASGSSYSGGVGNTAINSQGRLCNKVGTTMQCF